MAVKCYYAIILTAYVENAAKGINVKRQKWIENGPKGCLMISIKSFPCTAWKITLPCGKVTIELWVHNATIEDVIHNTPRENGTTFMRIDVGVFEVSKIEHSYSGDARMLVLEDGKVELGFPFRVTDKDMTKDD